MCGPFNTAEELDEYYRQFDNLPNPNDPVIIKKDLSEKGKKDLLRRIDIVEAKWGNFDKFAIYVIERRPWEPMDRWTDSSDPKYFKDVQWEIDCALSTKEQAEWYQPHNMVHGVRHVHRIRKLIVNRYNEEWPPHPGGES